MAPSNRSAMVTFLLFLLLQLQLIQYAHLPSDYLSSRQTKSSSHPGGGEELRSRDITAPEWQYIEDLKKAYKGIFWDVAYPGAMTGDDEGGCTLCYGLQMSIRCWKLMVYKIDKTNILVEATRIGMILATCSGISRIREDPWFHRFFVRNRLAPEGGRWSSVSIVSSGHYAEIMWCISTELREWNSI